MNGEKASVVGVCVGAGLGGEAMREETGSWRKGARTDGRGPWGPLRDLAFRSEQNGSRWRVSGQIMQAIPGILASFLTLRLSIYLSPSVGWKSLEDPVSPSYLPLSTVPARPRTLWVLNK